jgi:hypothetical protein
MNEYLIVSVGPNSKTDDLLSGETTEDLFTYDLDPTSMTDALLLSSGMIDTLHADDGTTDALLTSSGMIDTLHADDGTTDALLLSSGMIDTLYADDGTTDALLTSSGLNDTLHADDGRTDALLTSSALPNNLSTSSAGIDMVSALPNDLSTSSVSIDMASALPNDLITRSASIDMASTLPNGLSTSSVGIDIASALPNDLSASSARIDKNGALIETTDTQPSDLGIAITDEMTSHLTAILHVSCLVPLASSGAQNKLIKSKTDALLQNGRMIDTINADLMTLLSKDSYFFFYLYVFSSTTSTSSVHPRTPTTRHDFPRFRLALAPWGGAPARVSPHFL